MRIRAILLLFAFLLGTTAFSAAQSCFTDYGIGAAVSENRSMNAGRIRDFDMPAGTFECVRPDGTVKQVSFDYESRGANISRLIDGPDGNL